MPPKKKVVENKPTAKKKIKKVIKPKLSIKWNWDKHQIPVPWDYFVAKWVEGRVVRINSPSAWINEVSINGVVFNIKNWDLRVQINKTKWFFQKKQTITKGEYVVWKKLTFKQLLFCNHYIKNDALRWNATLCYNAAFDFKLSEKNRTRDLDKKKKEIAWTSEYDRAYNSCSVQASVLLRNLKIQEENTKLWNELLTDNIVDSRIAKILISWKDWDSINAIKEYNKMNWRIIDRSQVTETKEIVHKLSKEQIDKMNPKQCDEYLKKLINDE